MRSPEVREDDKDVKEGEKNMPRVQNYQYSDLSF